jgi:hypothetical protein
VTSDVPAYPTANIAIRPNHNAPSDDGFDLSCGLVGGDWTGFELARLFALLELPRRMPAGEVHAAYPASTLQPRSALSFEGKKDGVPAQPRRPARMGAA